MNNEDKILSALDTLVFAVNNLAAGQAKLETEIADVKSELSETKKVVILIENENKQVHGALLDGYSLLHDISSQIHSDVADLKADQEKHEIHIKWIENNLQRVL